MSKRNGIRWNEDLNRETIRTVRNFNAKVKRLEQKYQGRSDIVIPEKVSVKELKSLVNTKRDLSRELNSLQRFSKRGSEEIVDAPIVEDNIKITKWQKTEMNRMKGLINRSRSYRKKQIEEIEMTSGGKKLGYSVGQFGMGKAEELSLKPTNSFTPKMQKWDIQKKFKSLRKHSQSDYFERVDSRLIDNFTKAIEQNYGDQAKEIIDSIKNMKFKDFYKKFKSEPGMFEFAYFGDDKSKKDYFEHLKGIWVK